MPFTAPRAGQHFHRRGQPRPPLRCPYVSLIGGSPRVGGRSGFGEAEREKRDSHHHGDLKRAPTAAALQLVQEKGHERFTLRELARRAGVSAAAPYRLRWAVNHPDYYQVMFGSELGKPQSPEVLSAGERAFDTLLDTIVRCQRAGLLAAGDPRAIAGPIWSLLQGISMLTIGIGEDPESLTERALRDLLF